MFQDYLGNLIKSMTTTMVNIVDPSTRWELTYFPHYIDSLNEEACCVEFTTPNSRVWSNFGKVSDNQIKGIVPPVLENKIVIPVFSSLVNFRKHEKFLCTQFGIKEIIWQANKK